MAVPHSVLPLFLLPALANAQACLSLSTAVAAPDGTAVLELSLHSESELPPVSLQWTLQFPASHVQRIDGSASTVATKAVMCTGSENTRTCLVVGYNADPLAGGVIARVALVLAPDATTAVVSITDVFAASASGYFIPILSGSGTVTRAWVSPDRKLRPPLRRIAGSRCQAR